MKKLTKIATLLFAMVATVFTACQDPQEDVINNPLDGASLKVSLVGTDKTSATVSLEAEVIKVVGYVVEPSASKGEYKAADIFALENLITIEKEGATQVTFKNLTPDTKYTVQFAGRINKDTVWEQITSFEFTTEMRDPVLTAVVSEVKPTEATLTVTTDNLSRIAYLVKKYEEGVSAPKIPILFATGTVVKVTTGETTINISGLSPTTEYVVYFAGEIAGREEFFESVVTVSGIKTTDFTDQITIRDIDYLSFKVDLKVDPSVKEQNHVIKWGMTDLVMYNNNYYGGLLDGMYGGASMTSAINLDDKWYHNYVTESTTFTFDKEGGYIFDDLGNYTGSAYYDAFVPGQPEMIGFAEFKYGDMAELLGYNPGTMGYYVPVGFNYNKWKYDFSRRKDPWEKLDERSYWSDGFFYLDLVQIQKPEPLPDDAMEITTETSPKDGEIHIKVNDRNIEMVSLLLVEDEHLPTLMHYINDNEEYLQWYATSMSGMYISSAQTISPWYRYDSNGNIVGENTSGEFVYKLSEHFVQLNREYDYHIFAVGLAGDANGDGYLDGIKQCYKKFTVQLPPATKPAPEIIITAVPEATTTSEIAWNIKCPSGDLEDVVYAVNTRKEWERGGYTIAQALELNSGFPAAHFPTVAIMNINSEEGYTVTFPAAPGEELGMAIMGINDEGSKGISAICYNTALEKDAPEKIDSPLFESLKGTWTATTQVLTVEPAIDETTGEEIYNIVPTTRSCEVVVGDIEYPETLSEEIYELYETVVEADRATTDGYYAEFKAAADEQNQKNRDWNRILMNGFHFEAEDVPYYHYQSAFDLFCSSTYNGASSVSPVYDFGPKWFLELAEDEEGNISVSVPFNTTTFDPMSSWYYDTQAIYESHLTGYDYEKDELVGFFGSETQGYMDGHFPVEISEDGNTITIKPLLYEYNTEDGEVVNYTFYPSPAIYSGDGQFDPLEICAEIVLTRNDSAVAPALAPSKASRKAQSNHSTVKNNVNVKERHDVYSRTDFNSRQPKYEVKKRVFNSREEQAASFWKKHKMTR